MNKKQKLKVACLPVQNSNNPYQFLFKQGLTNTGSLEAFDGKDGKFFAFTRTALALRPDIVHVDWIHRYTVRRNAVLTLLQEILFVLDILICQFLGQRLVWTLHNFEPHDIPARPLVRRWFAHRCDLIRVFTEETVGKIEQVWELNSDHVVVVPEGSYRSVYPPIAPPLTNRFDKNIITFFGLVRPYKGVLELIEAFKACNSDTWKLKIIGAAFDRPYAARVADSIQNNPLISFSNAFVPAESFPKIFAETQLVCLPYLSIDNSGSIILAMDYGQAIVAPDIGAISARLAAQHDLLYTPGDLKQALHKAMSTPASTLASYGEKNKKEVAKFRWTDFGYVLVDHFAP